MNRKQLILLVLAGLVFGGIGLYSSRKKSESFERHERADADKLLGDFPVNDVGQIALRQHTNELNLAKGEVWNVKERAGYPANAEDIIEFARKLWDLKAAQSQKIGESQLGRLELLTPDKGGTNSATLVELKSKDGKPIKSLLLGKKSMRDSGDSQFGGGYPNGRWLYLPDKPGTAYLVSEAFSEIEPKPERWLSKDWFKVEKLKSISIVSTNATNSWKIARDTETGSWALADKKDSELIDTNKLSSVGYALSSPSFNDVLTTETKLDPSVTATLETFDNFVYTVRLASKTNDTGAAEENYLVNVGVTAGYAKERTAPADEKPEDKEKLDKEFKEKVQKFDEKLKKEKAYEKWTYVVAKWTVDPLLKERKEFFADKKEEPKTEPKAEEKKEADPFAPPPVPLKPE